MNVNDILHGFRVDYSQPLPELNATLWHMTYVKNGAELVWLDRPDDNKTFAIAFKTLPEDHTGVFHILEHSVLCGSAKYPVKEPFVELIKSSLQTFLNAFTFPDKTMYPVCSRNDQDFLNLMDVYLDAVFHPLSLNDPHAFLQEGWHYELDSEDGELRCNGVVYNEMKGVYASPDSILESKITQLLFPDNCYGCDSGGDPDHIPELTYEHYLASHKRFYHPSNGRIFLDGQVELDGVLAKLDSFLREYDYLKVYADIPMQAPVTPEEGVYPYEVGAEDSLEQKAVLAGGWVYADYAQPVELFACAVLSRLLCSSNEAPLKKALLERGLAEDVEFQPVDGTQQAFALLVIRNVDENRRDEVWQVVRETLTRLADEGLDHARLEAILNHFEFSNREKEFGSMPAGLIYGINMMESWLYGGDPAQNLCRDEVFRTLRANIETGWFEQFLRRAMLDNPHRATVCLIPSKTLGEEKRVKEAQRLAQVKAGWSAEQCRQVMADFQTLRQRQEAEDTPEQIATLPHLELSDLRETIIPTPQNVSRLDGVTVLHQPLDTDGILHLQLYFSLAEVPQEQFPLVSFFTELLAQVATEHYTALELRSQIEAKLGRLNAAALVLAPKGDPNAVLPFLVVNLSVLESKKEEAIALLDEVLNRSRFDDVTFVGHLLRQQRLEQEQDVVMSGNSFATTAAAAGHCVRSALSDALFGLTQLRWIQQQEDVAALCDAVSKLAKTLISRHRVTVSVTGVLEEDWVRKVIAVLPAVPMGAAVSYHTTDGVSKGVAIPAQIGFAAKAAFVPAFSAELAGAAQVAGQVLTYGHLWNTVRVKGGAYGTGLRVSPEGNLAFMSYRDPNPAQSLKAFDASGAVLREVCDSGEGLTNSIISTIASVDRVMTPRSKGYAAAHNYFTGNTPAERQRVRSSIIHTTHEQLRTLSVLLDEACGKAGTVVIGGRNVLQQCCLENVEPLERTAQ